MSSPRAGKVAERIHQIVARRLEKGLRDPRLGFVTITDVRVTGDLQHASIFFTVYGSDEEQADSAAALRAATGMLRTEVGRQLGTRLTPTLEFIRDELPETAEHLSDLLAEARRRDEEARALAASAQYAGDPDPYLKPREVSDDADDDLLEALDEVDVEDDDDFSDEGEDGPEADERGGDPSTDTRP